MLEHALVKKAVSAIVPICSLFRGINPPLRMRRAGYSSRCVCLSVCVSRCCARR